MNCPRCDNQILDEKDRDGVVIDVCRKCRGIWLDRGELEKLIARASAESDDDERRGGVGRDDDDDDDDDNRNAQRGGRKRRWFDSFGDIFD